MALSPPFFLGNAFTEEAQLCVLPSAGAFPTNAHGTCRAYTALPVFLVIGWGNWNVLLVARSEISFSIPNNLTRSYQVWASVLPGLSPHDLSVPRSTLEWLRYPSELEYLHCLDAEPLFFTCPAGREEQRLDKGIWWLKIQCPKKFASLVVLFPRETEGPHYMGQ